MVRFLHEAFDLEFTPTMPAAKSPSSVRIYTIVISEAGQVPSLQLLR